MPYLILGLLALMWGTSFLLIRLAILNMSPTTLVLIQTGTAALTLLAVTLATHRYSALSGIRARVVPFSFMAFFSGVFPFVAISWGELTVSTGVISLINATIPIWTAVLAFWMTPYERPTRIVLLGVMVGFLGTGLLFTNSSLSSSTAASMFGMIAILASSASYAVAALYQRKRLSNINPLECAFWQMTLSALVMLPLAAPTIAATQVRGPSMAAAISLGLVFGFGYTMYYYLLNSLGATRATTVAYLIPVAAIFWGVTILHEVWNPLVVAGAFLILFALFLTSRQTIRRPVQTVDTGAVGAAITARRTAK